MSSLQLLTKRLSTATKSRRTGSLAAKGYGARPASVRRRRVQRLIREGGCGAHLKPASADLKASGSPSPQAGQAEQDGIVDYACLPWLRLSSRGVGG